MPAAINFTKSYRRWYGKEMDERYPKFGMLGFDTGYFFLKGLSRYGSELEKNMQRMDLVPIQTGFKFQTASNRVIPILFFIFIVFGFKTSVINHNPVLPTHNSW